MRRLVALCTLVLAAGLAPAAARAEPLIARTCNGSADCGGWFTQPVTVDWTVSAGSVVSGCADVTLTQDTPGARQGCIAGDGTDTIERTVTVRLDRTAPAVTGARPERSTDAGGWYGAPVLIAFTGADATSGVAACTATTYAGPDAGAAVVPGTCRDAAGNQSAALEFQLRYDATAPAVTDVRPERPPDHRGWYLRPVSFAVAGADALSGLAGCAPVTYAGPDGVAAGVVATCVDRAGNAASRSVGIRYDATAPDAGAVRAATGDRVVRLRWPAAATARVVRRPGVGGKPRSVLHRGRGTALTDRRVRNGHRYRYRVTLTDAAGNRAAGAVRIVPRPHLIGPPRGAVLEAPPLLRWTPVRGAGYYNVQLYRDGRKVLSAWPRRPRLQLPATWRFGRSRPLVPPRRLPLARVAGRGTARGRALRAPHRRPQLRRALSRRLSRRPRTGTSAAWRPSPRASRR